MRITTLFCLQLLIQSLFGQGGYTSWIVGDTTDAAPAGFQPGLVLAGGGGDNDDAMKWMLERAAGGDVLVIRASGAEGYNNYFYSQLGVAVNSVETIRFDSAQAAYDPYVAQRIRDAEVLFIAGGDQYDYYTYWKDTPIGAAIQYLLTEKQVTVGGTSAGMAILGQAYYAPSGPGIVAAEALGNPFHAYMNVLGWNDFLQAPYMEHTITDTHFDQRNRAGRTMTFLARLAHDHGFRAKGIAANEYTAVCVDENGQGRVFGEYPQYPEDLVYFLQVNCESPIGPETCEASAPLHWDRGQQAVKAYVVPATPEGEHAFQLTDWTPSDTGSVWEDWWVNNGALEKIPDAAPADCATWSALEARGIESISFRAWPNPFQEQIWVKTTGSASTPLRWTLHSVSGHEWGRGAVSSHFSIETHAVMPGMAILTVWNGHEPIFRQRLVKL
jgi:cyanophycinase